MSKSEAIGKYYDMYYEEAEILKKEFPDQFGIYEIEDLNNHEGVKSILSFCNIEEPHMNIYLGSHHNKSDKKELNKL